MTGGWRIYPPSKRQKLIQKWLERFMDKRLKLQKKSAKPANPLPPGTLDLGIGIRERLVVAGLLGHALLQRRFVDILR